MRREDVRRTPLSADHDIEVGREGIGGFCEWQAEWTILTLREAGFRVVRDIGNPYLVGEHGPETFIPNTSGRIVPNNKVTGE